MANEHSDSEATLLKGLASIEGFRREVRSFKTRLGKLTGRVESLELMNFQEQLNRLDEQIAQQQKSLLDTQRFVASFIIISTHNNSNEQVEQKRPDAGKHSEFVAETTTAISKVSISNDPLSIARAFKTKRYEVLHKLGIKTITLDY